MRTLEDFYAMITGGLEEDPPDLFPYLVAADWCEENDHPQIAAGLKWMFENQKEPCSFMGFAADTGEDEPGVSDSLPLEIPRIFNTGWYRTPHWYEENGLGTVVIEAAKELGKKLEGGVLT